MQHFTMGDASKFYTVATCLEGNYIQFDLVTQALDTDISIFHSFQSTAVSLEEICPLYPYLLTSFALYYMLINNSKKSMDKKVCSCSHYVMSKIKYPFQYVMGDTVYDDLIKWDTSQYM